LTQLKYSGGLNLELAKLKLACSKSCLFCTYDILEISKFVKPPVLCCNDGPSNPFDLEVLRPELCSLGVDVLALATACSKVVFICFWLPF